MVAQTPELNLYRIEQLEREVAAQATELKSIEARLAARDAERSAAERKQLITGIIFLGGIITTLAGVLWTYRAVIFRGAP